MNPYLTEQLAREIAADRSRITEQRRVAACAAGPLVPGQRRPTAAPPIGARLVPRVVGALRSHGTFLRASKVP